LASLFIVPHSDRILAEIKMKMGDKAPPSGEVALVVSRSENCIESQSRARFQDEQRLPPPRVEHDFAGKISAKATSTSISIAFVIIDWNGEGHTTWHYSSKKIAIVASG
jgi:hypothetical protein